VLSSLVVSHVHTAWPPLDSPWCPQWSAKLDWTIRFLDTVYDREGSAP
jgi:hypothetical protein